MIKKTSRYIVTAILSLLFIQIVCFSAVAETELEKGYFTMVTESGKVITYTSKILKEGDMFIASDNSTYKVVKIDKHKAVAKYMEKAKISYSEDDSIIAKVRSFFGLQADTGKVDKSRPIAIYNTHSDESYIPTSGKSSEPKGDVYQVSKALEEELKRKNCKVIRSDANHNPHDGGAYDRSRRTAMQLIKYRPAAIVDVHRDATPPQVYAANVNGQNISKVKFVVGKQNQTNANNIEFAKKLKAYADKKYPGMVEGILWADGNYNQDLSPRSILVEVGSHINSLERANNGVRLLADVITLIAYGPETEQSRGRTSGNTVKTILWILGLTLAGAIIYFLINRGGSSERVKSGGPVSNALRSDDKKDTDDK